MTVVLYVLIASILCLALLILLIVLLQRMEKESLDIWLGFLKFFLGTFVIGLLGYFAKVSFDNRQMAIMESDQIGKYVDNAMLDDIEPRIRFAEYFSTVLQNEQKKGWESYLQKLENEEDEIRNEKDSLSTLKLTADSLEQVINNFSKTEIEQGTINSESTLKELQSVYDAINVKQKVINESSKIITDKNQLGSASIANPDDFITCELVKKLIPYGRGSEFKKGQHVYVHAYIQAPKKEKITIIWRDYLGKEWNRLVSYVEINQGRGFRLFDHVTPKNPGGYSVEMRNEEDEIIGFKKFTIIN